MADRTAQLDLDRVWALKEREDARFVAGRPRSAELLEAGRASMPEGIPNSWFRLNFDHPPVNVDEGKGAYFTALDLGLIDLIGFVSQEGWLVETLAGEPEAAERVVKEAYEILDRAGNNLRFLASDQLAQSLYERGRLEEAEEVARVSQEAGMTADDPFQAYWRLTKGKILARRGEFDEAERLVREGVRSLEPTQFLSDRGLSLLDLAEVLRLAARTGEAASAVEGAIDLFQRKGNVVSAERARHLLEELRAG